MTVASVVNLLAELERIVHAVYVQRFNEPIVE